jgi:hypothetical protein
MADKNIQEVIGKLVTDGEFRKQVMDNAEEALKDFNLQEDVIEGFKNLDSDKVKDFVENLDDRITKGFASIGG